MYFYFFKVLLTHLPHIVSNLLLMCVHLFLVKLYCLMLINRLKTMRKLTELPFVHSEGIMT